jgi:monoterpene epsilon-lactone hydrolase
MSKDQRDQIYAMLQSAQFDVSQAPEDLRANYAAFMGEHPLPDGVTAADVELGKRPAIRLTPDAATDHAAHILYFHGGGYVFGSPATNRPITANLVLRTGVPATSVDYRLAPEAPYPAAVEDGVAAYRELLENGVPAAGVIVAGDSAGAGLAAATVISARDAGLPMPAGLVLFSPYVDMTYSGTSMRTKEDADPLFSLDALLTLRTHYAGTEDPASPLLSPAVSADLAGLPPILIQVGTKEVLLDDATRLATRAAAADVSVRLDVVADVTHVFQGFAGMLDEADAALDRAATFIHERLSARLSTGPSASR